MSEQPPYVRWRAEVTGFITPGPSTPIVAQPQPQTVEGDAAPVAAWLRAVADQIDPPKPKTPAMRGLEGIEVRHSPAVPPNTILAIGECECGHGYASHGARGCASCPCKLSRTEVAAKRGAELRAKWGTSASPPAGSE